MLRKDYNTSARHSDTTQLSILVNEIIGRFAGHSYSPDTFAPMRLEVMGRREVLDCIPLALVKSAAFGIAQRSVDMLVVYVNRMKTVLQIPITEIQSYGLSADGVAQIERNAMFSCAPANPIPAKHAAALDKLKELGYFWSGTGKGVWQATPQPESDTSRKLRYAADKLRDLGWEYSQATQSWYQTLFPVAPVAKNVPVYLVLEASTNGCGSKVTMPGAASTRRTSNKDHAIEKAQGLAKEGRNRWLVCQVVAEAAARTVEAVEVEVKHVL